MLIAETNRGIDERAAAERRPKGPRAGRASGSQPGSCRTRSIRRFTASWRALLTSSRLSSLTTRGNVRPPTDGWLSPRRLQALAPDNSEQTGEDVILVVFVHRWQHQRPTDDDNLTAFRALLSLTVGYEREARIRWRRAAAGPWRLRRLARPLGFRLRRRRRRRDLLDPPGGWSTRGGRIGAGAVRTAASLSQPPAKARRKPAFGDRRSQLGGMIVFSALAQSLIQSASAPSAGQ